MVIEKVTAKALWEVIGTAQKPIYISAVVKRSCSQGVKFYRQQKEKENAQDIISSWLNVILATN